MITNAVKLKITGLILLILLSTMISYIALPMIGINPTYTDLNTTPGEIGLSQDVAYSSFPIRFVLGILATTLVVYWVAVTLDYLISYFIPADYTLARTVARRLVHFETLTGFLATFSVGYAAFFPQDEMLIDLMRRLATLFYPCFVLMMAASLLALGGVQWRERRLPRWMSSLLMVCGGLSALLSILGVNLTLPILRYGLLYLPCYFGLTMLGLFIFLSVEEPTPQAILFADNEPTVTPA
jgi:hypothetical protein